MTEVIDNFVVIKGSRFVAVLRRVRKGLGGLGGGLLSV
jgi:hypothetical protein